jgi:lipopolysaccharide transport system ATP-binding protein
MSAVISVEHLTKTYRLGTIGGGSLQEDVARWWARLRGQPDPTAKIGQRQHPREVNGQFWALEDVSFDVQEGEVLGIIGRNGAGKSTLLKILSQVTAPTSGRIRLRGRVASLLEVGTGFHPDLTGRENVDLNGAILGMTRDEIRRKFDEIVAFSECETFIDTPVKRYSSGMYVRLAFAVAAHLEPEILIVDEVLAVGDAQFQKKCLGKMGDVSRQGRTVLFVSHSMTAVKALCTRALLLRDGKMALSGDVANVANAYIASDARDSAVSPDIRTAARTGSGKGRFTTLAITPIDSAGVQIDTAVSGCSLLITLGIQCHEDFSLANVGVEFYDNTGYRLIDVSTALGGDFLSLRAGQAATVTFTLESVLLKPGRYRLGTWLGRATIENIDYVESAGTIDFHDDLELTRHTQVFPGPYQCRFSHSVAISDLALVGSLMSSI